MTAQVLEEMWMFWRELMQTIAEPHRQFLLLYLDSPAEADTYFKDLRKARREKKEGWPTVEADSLLDIFAFTHYDI